MINWGGRIVKEAGTTQRVEKCHPESGDVIFL